MLALLVFTIYIYKKEDRKVTQNLLCLSSNEKIQKFCKYIGLEEKNIMQSYCWVSFFLNLPYQYYAPLNKYPLTFTYLKSLYSLNIVSFQEDLRIPSLHYSKMYFLFCHSMCLLGVLSMLFSMLEVSEAYGELMFQLTLYQNCYF